MNEQLNLDLVPTPSIYQLGDIRKIFKFCKLYFAHVLNGIEMLPYRVTVEY